MSLPCINQLSQCYVTINYLDENDNPFTPSAVSWRVWDGTNNVLLQDWTAIGGTLGTSSQIIIPPTLNQLGSEDNPNELRVVIFQITLIATVIRYDFQGYTIIAVPTLANLT
jgi:hypothetical protein